MDGSKEFLVLRYSLVEERQGAIDVLKLPFPKGRAVLVAITDDREFTVNGVLYGFVGFSFVQPMKSHNFPSERYLMGKVAKLRQAHVGRKIPGDIVETNEDDWQPIRAVFDLQRQFIFVERDWRFGTPEQTIRALQGGMRSPVMTAYNHSIFVEGCVRTEHFWKIISSHKKIYKLELKLISPNILETNLRARDALAALKGLFGQDQIKIDLTNDRGDLSVPKNPVDDYLEYIQEGEGTWSLTTEGDHGGKKTYSSSENIDTVVLPNSSFFAQEDSVGALNNKDNGEREAAFVEAIHSEMGDYRER